jgi:hypothetical protein
VTALPTKKYCFGEFDTTRIARCDVDMENVFMTPNVAHASCDQRGQGLGQDRRLRCPVFEERRLFVLVSCERGKFGAKAFILAFARGFRLLREPS